MAEVWQADDDTVAALISKGRLLAPEDRAFILENLNVYYVSADNKIGEGDFNRVDRERWPDMAQEERLETMLETQSDRAERRGIERGMQEGIKQGIQQGMERGIEKKCHEAVARMLTRGMSEEQIRDVLQLTAEQLDDIKRRLKN